MITQHDLQEAIAECQGERHPNAATCIKLAAFYTIREHLYPEREQKPAELPGYSYAAPPERAENIIEYESDTDFGRLINGRDPSEVWPVVDELVSEALAAVNPRLYDAFLRRLRP